MDAGSSRESMLLGVESETIASLGPRFMSRVEVELGGCWIWLGAKLPTGYGRFAYDGARNGYAHRYAYLTVNGPLVAGLDICHRCDNPRCVNPSHLFAASRQDNIRDMIRKGRGHWQRDPANAKANGRRFGLAPKLRKLSLKDEEIVRYLLERGAFIPDIAKVFDVSTGLVSDVLHERKCYGIRNG